MRIHFMRRLAGRAGCALLFCAGLAGCASPPRPPADLDLARAVIVADPTPLALSIDGPSGKGAAAGTGAAKGAGTGLTVGTLACLGTGFFFPICISAVVPATAAVGAVGWAAVSATRAEGADNMERQRELLTRELAGGGHATRLAERLQQGLRERMAVELPLSSPSVREPAAWVLEPSLLQLASDSHAEGQPFALRVEGRLRLRRVGQTEPDYEHRLEVATDTTRDIAGWAAGDGAEMHAAVERAIQALADRLLSALAPSAAQQARR